jgi:hypothetical protein
MLFAPVDRLGYITLWPRQQHGSLPFLCLKAADYCARRLPMPRHRIPSVLATYIIALFLRFDSFLASQVKLCPVSRTRLS